MCNDVRCVIYKLKRRRPEASDLVVNVRGNRKNAPKAVASSRAACAVVARRVNGESNENQNAKTVY